MTRRVGRALVVALALSCAAVVVPASHAQEPGAQPRPEILQLISQTPVVEPDGDFALRVRVTGAPSDAKVQVEVHDRVPTRSDFNATLEGRGLRRTLFTMVVPATADASGVVVVTVPTRDVESQLEQDVAHVRIGEGVFPVVVTIASGSGVTIDSLLTYLVRMPRSREFGPLGVALVLPVGGPLALQPDGSASPSPSTAQAVLSTVSVLSAHPSVPATLDVTPETIDALEPSTAAELRDAASGRPLATSPYVRVRAGNLVAAGLQSELDRQLDLGAATVRRLVAAPDGATYIADDQLTTEAANALRDRGVRSLVIPEPALSPVDERLFNRTLTQPFELDGVGGVRAAGADAGLTAHAGETGDPVLDASHLLADLAVLYFDNPPDARAAVVAFDATKQLDPRLLDALLSGLDPSINRILRPITLTTLFATVPPAGSRGETNGRGTPLVRTLVSTPDAGLARFVGTQRDARADIESFRQMVTADNPRPALFERLTLAAEADGLSDAQRTAYLDGTRNAIRAELDKLQPPARQTITFTARDGVVSLTLRNTTGYPVTVRLVLEGEKLEFPGHDDGFVDVTLTEETTRVALTVRTRASGDSPLDITVTAPDDRLVIGQTRITVRSTAFSGVGVILSVGSGVFLAVWWLRHAVATRRARHRKLMHAAR